MLSDDASNEATGEISPRCGGFHRHAECWEAQRSYGGEWRSLKPQYFQELGIPGSFGKSCKFVDFSYCGVAAIVYLVVYLVKGLEFSGQAQLPAIIRYELGAVWGHNRGRFLATSIELGNVFVNKEDHDLYCSISHLESIGIVHFERFHTPRTGVTGFSVRL